MLPFRPSDAVTPVFLNDAAHTYEEGLICECDCVRGPHAVCRMDEYVLKDADKFRPANAAARDLLRLVSRRSSVEV